MTGKNRIMIYGSKDGRLKFKNLAAPAVKREAEEDWGKERWR